MTARLDELVAKINKAFEQVDAGRIRAGKLLLEAKSLVAPGQWRTWCESNVRRSFRDIQRLIAIASAPDPVVALQAARQTNAGYVATHRDRLTERLTKSPPAPTPHPSACEHRLYVFDGMFDTNLSIPTGADAETVAKIITAVPPPASVRIHGEFQEDDEDEDSIVQVAPNDPRATSWIVSICRDDDDYADWWPESVHGDIADAAKAALAILHRPPLSSRKQII